MKIKAPKSKDDSSSESSSEEEDEPSKVEKSKVNKREDSKKTESSDDDSNSDESMEISVDTSKTTNSMADNSRGSTELSRNKAAKNMQDSKGTESSSDSSNSEELEATLPVTNSITKDSKKAKIDEPQGIVILILILFKMPISSELLFSYLILYITQWTSAKEKFDLDKMQSFLEVLKTFKFVAILILHSYQSSLRFEWVVT